MIHLGSICVVGLENHNLVLSQLFDFQEEQSSTLLLSSFFDAVGFVLWVKEDFFIQIMDWHVRNEADVDMTCQFAFPSNVKSYTYKGYSKWPLVYDPWWLLNSNYLTIMGWCWDNHLICKKKKELKYAYQHGAWPAWSPVTNTSALKRSFNPFEQMTFPLLVFVGSVLSLQFNNFHNLRKSSSPSWKLDDT